MSVHPAKSRRPARTRHACFFELDARPEGPCRCNCRASRRPRIRQQWIARSPRPRAVVARFERPAGARCLEFPVGAGRVACHAGGTRGGQRRTYGLPFVQRDSPAIGRLDVPGCAWVRPRCVSPRVQPRGSHILSQSAAVTAYSCQRRITRRAPGTAVRGGLAGTRCGRQPSR